jgi:YHS domain-containing protein
MGSVIGRNITLILSVSAFLSPSANLNLWRPDQNFFIPGQGVNHVVFMAIDPVCKMEADERTAKWKSTYQGKIYYFCAPGCKKAFDADPEKFL